MRIIQYQVTLAVDDEGWNSLMEDATVDTQVRADLKAAVAEYDADHMPLVEIDGW